MDSKLRQSSTYNVYIGTRHLDIDMLFETLCEGDLPTHRCCTRNNYRKVISLYFRVIVFIYSTEAYLHYTIRLSFWKSIF